MNQNSPPSNLVFCPILRVCIKIMSLSAPNSPTNYFFFLHLACNKLPYTLSRKKLSRNHHIVGMDACKQAVYTPIFTKLGKDRHIYVRAWPRPSHSMWAENIANTWLPSTNIWRNFKGPNSKVGIKNSKRLNV